MAGRGSRGGCSSGAGTGSGFGFGPGPVPGSGPGSESAVVAAPAAERTASAATHSFAVAGGAGPGPVPGCRGGGAGDSAVGGRAGARGSVRGHGGRRRRGLDRMGHRLLLQERGGGLVARAALGRVGLRRVVVDLVLGALRVVRRASGGLRAAQTVSGSCCIGKIGVDAMARRGIRGSDVGGRGGGRGRGCFI